ncbi:MAG TPA: 4-alpha-glucanotransferase [Acetobacteraceae bacterium]|nr:4-alpha-glucanotransferase [Acetobacteraceae bacterium]
MSDAALRALAHEAGLQLHWRDAFGADHEVIPETLRAVLATLGLPAASEAQIEASRAQLRQEATSLPPLVTAECGEPAILPVAPGRFRLDFEEGGALEGEAAPAAGGAALPAIDRPGYHRLALGDREITLAVAPRACFGLEEAAPGRRPWGLAVQLYALRRAGDGGLGDLAALQDFVPAAASHGAAAVAISPVHAQFTADPDRFSPYAPSSRAALNVLCGNPGPYDPDPQGAEEQRLEAAPLLDWPAATRARIARLRRAWERARGDGALRAELAAFRAELGDTLETHARFEALHEALFGADRTRWNWRGWPAEFCDPANPAVAAFARDHAEAVDFHAFAQFLADRGLRQAQQAARAAGMPVGLISDLAVGTDAGGSHSWSRQRQTLLGLVIGAPPDLLSREGQNWGITAFSPRGLRAHGYGAFLEMLRTSLRHAGGVRIDHAMGLARLWVAPEGWLSKDGVYLHFPVQDLLRLVALESRRHRAVVLGEDLGTLPEGFHAQLQRAGIIGMRVLWFERDGERFRPPSRWTRDAAAMTSTHDLATVAGWWCGRDLDWRARLDLLRDEAGERAERVRDRTLLWQAMRESGAAEGEEPAPEAGDRICDAAARHVGRASCRLALLPVEDALAIAEQPNLPGTLHEHPNWQRRLPGPAATLLDDPAVAARLAGLDAARRDA